jgi:hypothetical protein
MIEIWTTLSLAALAARAMCGVAQNNPACPIVLRNTRRVGELTRHSLAEMNVRDNSINAKLKHD